MNELEKRAKFHKKRRKGLSPFCKLDAGNVELNNAIFNANTPTEGPSNNPISGPFGGDVGAEGGSSGEGMCDGGTCAMGESLEQITEKDLLIEGIRREDMIQDLQKLGRRYNWNKYSDAQLFRMWERATQHISQKELSTLPEDEYNPFEEAEYCEYCGRKLTDVTKECPLCDIGDTSVLEEAYDSQEEVKLEYEAIPVEIEYGNRSWEDGTYDKCFTDDVKVTYTITKEEAVEVLQDKLYGHSEYRDMTDEEFEHYIQNNIDELIDKYIDILKEYYYDYAANKAHEETDPYEIQANEEANYWDSVYDDRFDESVSLCNKDTEFNEDDEFDMFIRGI